MQREVGRFAANLSLRCTINWSDNNLPRISNSKHFTTWRNSVIIKSNKCSFGGEW